MDQGKVIDSKAACEGKWYWGLENICTKKQNPKSVKRSLFQVAYTNLVACNTIASMSCNWFELFCFTWCKDTYILQFPA